MPRKRARPPKRLSTRLRQLSTLRSETERARADLQHVRRAAAERRRHTVEQRLGLVRDARADDAQFRLALRRRRVAGGVHSRTTTMCMRRGPWAPSSIVCSMSPVRDGPVMVLTVRGMRSLP